MNPTLPSLCPCCLKTSDVAMYADDTTPYYSSPPMDDINDATRNRTALTLCDPGVADPAPPSYIFIYTFFRVC